MAQVTVEQLKAVRHKINVTVSRIGAEDDQVYRVTGTVGAADVDGKVKFYDGGDFDNQVGCSDNDIIAIFTQLDEQGWDV